MKRFDGKRILLTGHTGFKGSWMACWAREEGATVIGFSTDSAPPDAARNYRLCGLPKKIFHVTSDVRNAECLGAVIRDSEPDLVIHFAAQPLVKVSYQEPKRTFDTNVAGVVNLLEAVRKTKSVKAAIVVTTDKVYTDQKWPYPYREIDPLGGHDPYSASKAAAEKVVESYRLSWAERNFADHPVNIATVRGGNAIGGGDFAPYRFLPDCMRSLIRNEPVQVRSPGAIRPYQHVLDLLSGYLCLGAKLLSDKGNSFCGAWNFGPIPAKDVPNETVVKKAIEHWGTGSYEVVPPSADDVTETFILKLDSSKAAHYLSWHAAYDLDEAIRATVDWFKEYQEQLAAGTPVDMYPVCIRQIEEYVSKARSQGLAWATT
jgi:CDP-glucose 4,6-dehydratase